MMSQNRYPGAFLSMFSCLVVATLVIIVVPAQVSADIVSQWPERKPFDRCAHGSVFPKSLAGPQSDTM